MAASIVPHPPSSIPLEADLVNVFERDDPTLMSLTPLEELATAFEQLPSRVGVPVQAHRAAPVRQFTNVPCGLRLP
jgi:hypothetical protein